MRAIPLLVVAIATAVSFLFTVRIGALALAVGLGLIALISHLQRASRSPWRSQGSDLLTLVGLALGCALLALLLP